MKNVTLILIFSIIILSCKNEKKTNEIIAEVPVDSIPETTQQIAAETNLPDTGYMDFTVNDTLAKKVTDFLKSDYLKADYGILMENDKKFQLAQIDLNNDGDNELFINFFSSYFCGTGGCTLLLLDSNLKPITKFTVTKTPLFVQKEVENGWNTILVRFQDKFVKLVYDGKSYPPNPSLISPVDYAPSGHDLVLFDDNFSPSKTYTF